MPTATSPTGSVDSSPALDHPRIVERVAELLGVQWCHRPATPVLTVQLPAQIVEAVPARTLLKASATAALDSEPAARTAMGPANANSGPGRSASVP